MKKINIYIFSILLTLSFNMTASLTSTEPTDYLKGHYIYKRYHRDQRIPIQRQLIFVLLARNTIQDLNYIHIIDRYQLHSQYAHILNINKYPIEYHRNIGICSPCELKSMLHNQYVQAYKADPCLAEQYLNDLKKLQFIKKQQYFLPDSQTISTPEKLPITQKKPCDGSLYLKELPKINPFGVIGPKSQQPINSPISVGQSFSPTASK